MKTRIWRVKFENGACYDVCKRDYISAVKVAEARAIKDEYPKSELTQSSVTEVRLIAEED